MLYGTFLLFNEMGKAVNVQSMSVCKSHMFIIY